MPELDAFDHRAILGELEVLVRETYQLWDQVWVGFTWRNYTFDHVQRVRALARTLCRGEGGDVRVVDYAGLLHDVTKSYDGEIIVKDGKRVLDENGFWKNEFLPPARRNRLTDLYDRLGLAGMLHNLSGARIGEAFLAEYGLPAGFRARVAEAIRAHLKADTSCSVEGRCLYDADTIDANIGLPAFYRNIQISLHFQERQFAERGASLADHLQTSLPEYLCPYLQEKIPAWIDGKHNDFVAKMTTVTGRQVALERIGRLGAIIRETVQELEDFDYAVERGRLAIVRHFMLNRSNPALSREMAYLSNDWQHEGQRTPGAAELVTAFMAEIEGRA